MEASPQSSEANDLLTRDRDFAKSVINGDADRFASYMADDFVMVILDPGSNGTPGRWTSTSKQEWVTQVRTQTTRYSSVELTQQTVHLQGAVATITGAYSQKAVKDGKDYSSTGNYVETWIKKNGRWLAVNGVFP
ncbi:MAG TPA: nuclear transport factor 2 family protein [Steroidobacteraceae bacterium]|nr:nuclear transport factor 2 family protein [Steroidobacteraceae bacterium]